MDISFNDLSFKGQFTSTEEIKFCFETLTCISQAAKQLTNNKPIRRTRTLANRNLTATESIRSYMNSLFGSQDPLMRDLLNNILQNFVTGPFIEESEFNDDFKTIKSICNESIDRSSLHAYMSQNKGFINAVISAPNNAYTDQLLLLTDNVKKEEISILNFNTFECCSQLFRKFESNSKHEIRKTKKVNGKTHTKMDLDNTVAQQCLSSGIQILNDDYVYGFINNQWYEFPKHTDGCYHGYPIGNPTNNQIINQIKRIYGEPPYNHEGYQFCSS